MITILMPIYNGIEYLEESLPTILNQTYQDWELVIGVNGHPENSNVYQQANQHAGNKVRVFDLQGVKGKSQALNEMLKYASYDWISLLDVDDKWLPDKLSNQVQYMNQFDVIGSRCTYFGDRNGTPHIPLGDISEFDFLRVNPIINSSCLIKKELCHWNDKMDGVEDYDLWLNLWKHKKRFFNVDRFDVLHRIHKQSAFNNHNSSLVEDLKKKYQ